MDFVRLPNISSFWGNKPLSKICAPLNKQYFRKWKISKLLFVIIKSNTIFSCCLHLCLFVFQKIYISLFISSALTGWDFVPCPESEVCRGLAEGGQWQSWSCSPSLHRFSPPAVVLSGEDIEPSSTFCTAPELTSDWGRFMVIYKILCCIFHAILKWRGKSRYKCCSFDRFGATINFSILESIFFFNLSFLSSWIRS